SEFESHHGKLIMFMGSQDPVGAADEAINYYDAVEARAPGASRAQRRRETHFSTATRDSEPPVSDAQHDMAIALQDWVERGAAPQALIATKFDKEHGAERRIAFQRPLCVYPQVARYGGGSTNSATSFTCV